jgi:hypothetical protein
MYRCSAPDVGAGLGLFFGFERGLRYFLPLVG